MAKTTKETKAVAVKAETVSTHTKTSVLISPRVTEKAANLAELSGAYVFNVKNDASKKEIAKAVASMYKVTPRMVRTVAVKAKNVFVRGKWGVKQGGKKAYVYLKKGDKIEFV